MFKNLWFFIARTHKKYMLTYCIFFKPQTFMEFRNVIMFLLYFFLCIYSVYIYFYVYIPLKYGYSVAH